MAILNDGYQTTITFTSSQISSGVTISNIMEEKEVPPPGIAGGGAIDTTSMRNSAWRTAAAKSLKSLQPITLVVAYDPDLYDEMINMVNDNQEITITFPDGSTLVFWGFVDEFVPNALTEGEQPTANVTIVPTNKDDSGSETAPVYTP